MVRANDDVDGPLGLLRDIARHMGIFKDSKLKTNGLTVSRVDILVSNQEHINYMVSGVGLRYRTPHRLPVCPNKEPHRPKEPRCETIFKVYAEEVQQILPTHIPHNLGSV